MKIDPVNDSALIIHSISVGTVTRKMVRERAAEVGLINGRAAGEVSKIDWEQAKRELIGGLKLTPEEPIFRGALESDRWDPLPGLTGQIITVPSTDDGEDIQATCISERL